MINDEFFEPDNSARAYFGPEQMRFDVRNGVGRLTAYNPGLMIALYPGVEVRDFTLSLRLQAPNPAPNSGYGLILRSDNPEDGLEHYYYLRLKPAHGSLYLGRYQQGEFSTVVNESFQALMSSATDPIDLDLRMEGAEVEVRINGEMIVLAEDPQPLLGAGGIGLAIGSPMPGDFVEFDHLYLDPLSE